MRLWHYKLIPVLPNKMLIAQWRECIAIKRQWEKGTLKHRLVSYVMKYHKSTFRAYVMSVVGEMNKRKIKYQYKYYDEIFEWSMDENYLDVVYYPEHNDRYLKQCFYNLEEKHDRGIISEVEWQKIIKKGSEIMTKKEKQVRESLQAIAANIKKDLPENMGFCLLAYEFGDDTEVEGERKLLYVSNSNREDVMQAMVEFLQKNIENPDMFGKDV